MYQELTVDIPREELLDKLRENRATHKTDFLTALEGYKIELVKEIEAKLEAAKTNKPVERMIRQVEPEDHTQEYDEVIEMYEMSPQALVTLTQSDFRQLVRDDWGWKQGWSASNSGYIAAASAR